LHDIGLLGRAAENMIMSVTMAAVMTVNVFRIVEKSVKEGAGEDPVEKFDGTNGSSGERDGHHVCNPCKLANIQDKERNSQNSDRNLTQNVGSRPSFF
jgi:hypothetical protein